MTLALTWLADVPRAAGLNVAEEPGWKTRGVWSNGRTLDMGEIKGIIAHHTAGPKSGDAPSLNIVIHGDASLSGPRAHYVLARSGTVHVVAAGLAYHAGKGSGFGLPTDNANPHMIGIEAENMGTAEDPWPAVQVDAYGRLCASILKHIGAPVTMCIGHKEWAPTRKIDPSFPMDAFRDKVQSFL